MLKSEAQSPDAQSPEVLKSEPEGGDKPLSFEQAMQRLVEIVESLEEGEQPLEDSIKLFEEGMKLAQSSQKILDRAERRIEELLSVDASGAPIVRELPDE
jgi:exodeoxyribonuclease VII small subunit